MPPSAQRLAARALWITGERRCELRSAALRAPAPGEVLVESLHGAISRGTERLIFEGRVPPSEHARMRGPNQEGDFPFPVKYGYAVVGRVADGPEDLAGRIVFCLHPHQDRFLAGADGLVPLPAGLSPERAVLGANMETALNVVWDAGIQPGDRVGVVGAGLVGLLVAALAAGVPGASVHLVDVDEGRRRTAEALGATFSTPDDIPGELDVVVHLSGTAEGLETGIAMAGFEARVVEASWYGAGRVCVPLGGAFHSRRLSIVASQVGAVPPARRARWSNARRMRAALELLRDDRLDILISGATRFDHLADEYAGILGAPGTLCHRIDYRKD